MIKMKKFLLVLSIGAFAACNNSSSSDKAVDSAAKAATDTLKAVADSAKNAIDSTRKAAVDTIKAKADSAKKM
jgi:hypothetical protein